ncbi:MAG TPA: type II toxin-antitoxin system VapC family toxin [Candidatus Nanoarchaeia archaeon]|nr:type II toxin-antitoxin system VapC family toxin [Candidatus Nanoarchaeia archaeon]
MIVFDSYAWIEYFSGSDKGNIVKNIIESKDEILTPAICIAEIKRKYIKEKKEHEPRLKFIILRSKVIKIDLNIALMAASLSEKHKLYIIDALIYASALAVNSELLTGDQHFKGLGKIKFL